MANPNTLPQETGPMQLRKVRKGTHSCTECKRRKVKCVFTPENPQTCRDCMARNARCIDQRLGVVTTKADSSRPNLRQRVAQLEKMVLELQADREKNVPVNAGNAPVDDVDPSDMVEASRSEFAPNTPLSLKSPIDFDGSFKEDDSLFSLIDNNYLSRDSSEADPDMIVPNFDASGDVIDAEMSTKLTRREPKNGRVRQLLLSKVPSVDVLRSILDVGGSWWTRWRPMSLQYYETSLTHYVYSALYEQEDPVVVALGLLCVALSLDQRTSEEWSHYINIPQSVTETSRVYFELVDKLILHDDEYLSTFASVELLVFLSKIHANRGQAQKSWLIYRKAILFSQLIGIDQAARQNNTDPPLLSKRCRDAWIYLLDNDRFTSLLLGLPHAVAVTSDDLADLDDMPLPSLNPEIDHGHILSRLSTINGLIIDHVQFRRQSTHNPSLVRRRALAIDRRLKSLALAVPAFTTLTVPNIPENLHHDQPPLCFHFRFHHMRVALHQSYILQPRLLPKSEVEYNVRECLDACREVLKTYAIMRIGNINVEMVRLVDFEAFQTAVVLLVGTWRDDEQPRPNPLGGEEKIRIYQQGLRDRELINSAMRGLERQSHHRIAEQGLHVLRFLVSVKDGGGGGEDATGSYRLSAGSIIKIVIPLLGTLVFPSSPLPSQDLSPGTVVVDNDYENDSDDGEEEEEEEVEVEEEGDNDDIFNSYIQQSPSLVTTDHCLLSTPAVSRNLAFSSAGSRRVELADAVRRVDMKSRDQSSRYPYLESLSYGFESPGMDLDGDWNWDVYLR